MNALRSFDDLFRLRDNNVVFKKYNSSLKFETMAKRLYAAQPKSSLTV
jgi:hypothetical protein